MSSRIGFLVLIMIKKYIGLLYIFIIIQQKNKMGLPFIINFEQAKIIKAYINKNNFRGAIMGSVENNYTYVRIESELGTILVPRKYVKQVMNIKHPKYYPAYHIATLMGIMNIIINIMRKYMGETSTIINLERKMRHRTNSIRQNGGLVTKLSADLPEHMVQILSGLDKIVFLNNDNVSIIDELEQTDNYEPVQKVSIIPSDVIVDTELLINTEFEPVNLYSYPLRKDNIDTNLIRIHDVLAKMFHRIPLSKIILPINNNNNEKIS